MTTDISITAAKSHAAWLECCLKTIEKHCHGFRDVVLVADVKHEEAWIPLTRRFKFVRLVMVPENGNGHLVQMAHKTGAHRFTDADQILYADADHLFRRSCSPDDFMRDGKPIIGMASYESLKHAHVHPDGSTHPVPWQPVTEKAMGEPVAYEYMRIPGQMYPRWLPEAASAFLAERFKMSADDYILSCEPTASWPRYGYSEFNYLGAFAHKFHGDKFTMFDLNADPFATRDLCGNWPIDQGWTHGNVMESPWKERVAAALAGA